MNLETEMLQESVGRKRLNSVCAELQLSPRLYFVDTPRGCVSTEKRTWFLVYTLPYQELLDSRVTLHL
jgi:hypothetical protein